jgi:hypothetical protein
MPGRGRRGVSLILSGLVHGYTVSVAEYSYTQTSTSTTRLPPPGPPVEVAARHGLSKLGRALFGDRPTALGYEPFDRVFRIAAKDPAAARQLVGPVLAGEHIAGRVPPWSLRGVELLTYQSGHLTDPARVPDLAAPLVRVATLLGR